MGEARDDGSCYLLARTRTQARGYTIRFYRPKHTARHETSDKLVRNYNQTIV